MNPPPPSGQMVGGGAHQQLNMQQIGNLVRFWVHYDSMVSELNKQVKSARDVRNNYERQILQSLKSSNMANPVIQIAGGRITVAEEKHQQPLNYKTLETMLHQYYRQKPGSRDETADILKFLKTNRQTEVGQILKRTMTG